MIRLSILFFVIINIHSLRSQDIELSAGDSIPELKLFRENGTTIQLNEIEANYTLLLFWHYKCSHCQKALDKIDKFLATEKPKELKILSIYPFSEEVEKFWSFVNEPLNLLTDSVFIHATDPRASTRRSFSQKAGQPPLLILVDNKNSKIIEMNIKASELKGIWKKLRIE